MTNRLVMGAHPSLGVGIWLSRPGINVLTASADADFLLSSSLKNEQIFAAGFVPSLASGGGSSTVSWGITLPSAPLVLFQWALTSNSANHVPFNREDHPDSNDFYAFPTTTGCTFRNDSPGSFSIRMTWAALVRNLP
jgi:hypothetical protein